MKEGTELLISYVRSTLLERHLCLKLFLSKNCAVMKCQLHAQTTVVMAPTKSAWINFKSHIQSQIGGPFTKKINFYLLFLVQFSVLAPMALRALFTIAFVNYIIYFIFLCQATTNMSANDGENGHTSPPEQDPNLSGNTGGEGQPTGSGAENAPGTSGTSADNEEPKPTFYSNDSDHLAAPSEKYPLDGIYPVTDPLDQQYLTDHAFQILTKLIHAEDVNPVVYWCRAHMIVKVLVVQVKSNKAAFILVGYYPDGAFMMKLQENDQAAAAYSNYMVRFLFLCA